MHIIVFKNFNVVACQGEANLCVVWMWKRCDKMEGVKIV